MDWTLLSLICGLISGICWLIGDILLVGFDAQEEKYKNFLEHTIINNKEMAVLMLDGSIRRLRLGALAAHFSIPFMIFSVYSLYSQAFSSLWGITAAALLGIAFSISPVAHVAFYYVGTLCKSLFDEHNEGKQKNLSGEKLVNEYLLFLNITWVAAVGLTFLGWGIYTILILFGKTTFPNWFFLLTPLIMSPVAGILTSKLKIGRPYLNGAGLNIGLTIFFLAALLYYVF